MERRVWLGAIVLLGCGTAATPPDRPSGGASSGTEETAVATPPADPDAAARALIDHVRVATEARLSLEAQRASGEVGYDSPLLSGSVLDHLLAVLTEARELARALGAEAAAESLERARTAAAGRRASSEEERLAAIGPAHDALVASIVPITDRLEPASRACLRASHQAADAWVRLDQVLYRQRLAMVPRMRAAEERARAMERLVDSIALRLADLDGETQQVTVELGRAVYADVVEDLTALRALVGPIWEPRVDAMIERARGARTLAEIQAVADLSSAVVEVVEGAAAMLGPQDDYDQQELAAFAELATRTPHELAEQVEFVDPLTDYDEWAPAMAGVEAVVRACGGDAP